jgi:hypothetical protein
VIEVENLTKYYGILAAIEDASFTVREGEILGFLAQQYEIISQTTIAFESEDRRQDIFGVDEQSLTGAILKVSRETQKVVYFLTGHGERDPGGYDQSGQRCSRKGQLCCVSTLNLAISSTVPSDASVLIVAAPQVSLLEEESEASSPRQSGQLASMAFHVARSSLMARLVSLR